MVTVSAVSSTYQYRGLGVDETELRRRRCDGFQRVSVETMKGDGTVGGSPSSPRVAFQRAMLRSMRL